MSNKTLPLEGIKVVDLSTVVAAPTAAELLALFGADVIKVEAFGGDSQRDIGISLVAPHTDECNPLYTVQNSNKRHIAINLKSEEGKRAMLKLIEEADIFLSNVRGPALARLGLDYETLSAAYPKLIYAHFSGYGQKGPNAADPGFDSTVFWIRGGMIADWQTEDARYPFKPTYAFGDTVTASSFFSAILLALIGRENTGIGTKVETSLYSSAIWCNGQAVVSTQFEKKKLNPEPEKNTNPLIGYYRTADDKLYRLEYSTVYEKEAANITKVLGIDDVMSDPRYATKQTLAESGVYVEFEKRVAAAFKTKTAAEWKKLFQAASVPGDVVTHAYEIATDEQALANDYLEEVVYPDGTKVMMPVPPMFLSNYDRRPIVPAGPLGECTDEILKTIGYTEEEIKAMKENGAVK